ncbi:isocitrate dehydrogenase [Candidatus Neoehrlichia procyonis]|uniref:Isocitrate dehydrogenase [NADP] n=1 Tax=Candidatus Neoehrlichia procyonis str. RAC413 TaxID=1359163 RepID=A0A0F3NR89_9RICK|nr:isocitrate dehydrogenase [Candidatus Neoehrlichia lotoris]KJV69429.1 isocitrate dehydrogenase [Candidatus Neoehrlichia lotoris str. RAC413]
MSTPITVAYGDGIGPEIMEAVLLIIKEAQVDIAIETIEIGSNLYNKEWPSGIAPSSWESINRTKILLKSPIMTPQGKGHKSLNVTLRKMLGLYVNVRPCISYFPIIETKFPNLNIVIIRENEEDTYAGIEHRLTHDSFQCIKISTKSASEKICNYAFEYAKNNNRKKVSCLAKDNIMKMTDGIFHQSFDKVAKRYSDITSDFYIVDIGMASVANIPEHFDVVVTTNLYGDILSDIVALLSGSIGLAGSANIGDKYAMFEAVHGSAPNIAGKNIANPSGLLNAAIQMLIHLKKFNKAEIIYNALLKTLEDGIHTADIYNPKTSITKASTKEFAEAIINNLGTVPTQLQKLSLPKELSQATHTTQNCYTTQKEKKTLIGVDITIEYNQEVIKDIAKSLGSLNNALELVSIYSKGLELWPNLPYHIAYTDQISCRFYVNDKKKNISNNDINNLLINITEKEINILKTENLYFYDNCPGFFIL